MNQLNIFQETNPVAGSNVLVGAIYKNSAPTILVETPVVYTAPYTGQTQAATWTNLLDVAYRYVCYESPDGSPSGTIRNDFVVQPSNNAYQTRDDLFIIGGVTANFLANGTTYGPDASLPGWNWGLERVPLGTQQIQIQYIKTVAGVDTTQDDTTADGWRLVVSGDVIAETESWVLHFLPQLTVMTSTAPTNIISSISRISIPVTNLGTDAPGNAYLIQGGTSYLQINLPSLSSIPENEPIYFTSSGGGHINAGIFTNGTDVIAFVINQNAFSVANTINHLYLGQNENLAIYKATIGSVTQWLILYTNIKYEQVGEFVCGHSKQQINTVLLNGQILLRSSYARLWEWVNLQEPSILLASDTLWDAQSVLGTNARLYYTNRGRFTPGDGSTTFRVPDYTLYGFARFIANGPGAFQVGSTEIHSHTMHGAGPITGSGGQWWLSRNTADGTAYAGGGTDKFTRRAFASGADTGMRTGSDNDAGAVGTQLETRSNNNGLYPSIRI